MSKYKNIMENIELTEEMRERVLKNVKARTNNESVSPTAEQQHAQTEKTASRPSARTPVSFIPVRNAKRPALIGSLALAATALLIGGGIFFAWRNTHKSTVTNTSSVSPTSESIIAGGLITPDPSQTGVSGGIFTFNDISELNSSLGLTLSDLRCLPFTPTMKSYVTYDNFAEISYSTDSEECLWNINPIKGEIYALAENFTSSRTLKTDDGVTVELFGPDENSMQTAIFTDGTSYHAIRFLNTVDDSVFLSLVKEILSFT